MYSLKGFIGISDLVSNVVGEVSLLGEISSKSLTYSKEKGYYSDSTIPKIELTSFYSVLDSGGPGSKVPVPLEISTFLLNVGKWVNDNAQNTGIMGLVAGSYPAYISAINNFFTSVPFTAFEFADFAMGDLVTVVMPLSTDKKMPEWISFTAKYDGGTKDAIIKLWFADASFATQYDDYEIVVIPPIENLDDFFLSYNQVKVLVDAFTMQVLAEKVDVAKGDYPYTTMKIDPYNWVDSLIPPHEVPTQWTVLIYGAAGNNTDIIIETLRNYILNNSTHTLEEWVLRIPDIFRSTEFTILPFWNRYSIPNMTLEAGVYSPVIKESEIQAYLTEVYVDYTGDVGSLAIFNANSESSIFIYKSLAFFIAGAPTNRNDIFSFTDLFSDYMVVSPASGDFGKMSPETQAWIMFIMDVLLVAEVATSYSTIPFNMTRVYRNNIMFISATYNDVQYLVVAKKYFTDMLPPPEEL